MGLLECKPKNGTASVNTDSQLGKQEACFACATQVWLTVNHNTSVILANEFDVRSEPGSCQSNLCFFHEAMNSCINLKIH